MSRDEDAIPNPLGLLAVSEKSIKTYDSDGTDVFLVMKARELTEVFCTHPLVDMLQLTILSRISQCIALQTTQSLSDCYVSTRPHWNSIIPHPVLISPNAVSSRPE